MGQETQSTVMEVPREDGTISCIRFGNGAQPLVILPGLTVLPLAPSAERIAERYACLCDDFTVYLIDRRSNTRLESAYQEEDDPILPKMCTIQDLVDDVVFAMNELELVDVCLVGVSQGGMMAQQIAADYPELVKKVAFVSTTAQVSKDLSNLLKRWAILALSGEMSTLANTMSNKVYDEKRFEEVRKALIDPYEMSSTKDRMRMAACSLAAADFGGIPNLECIKAPSMVFAGDQDRLIPLSNARELADALGAPLKIYEGFSHACYDEVESFPEDLRLFFLS